jgi:NADH:ubiquinone oxidoreductase subunit
MTTLGTWILTRLRGALVGSDQYGNRYYRLKGDKPTGRGGGRFARERRWVIYKGAPEGSKVPPEWHAWLHHTVDEVPGERQRYAWEKPIGRAARCCAAGIAPERPAITSLGRRNNRQR